MNNEQFRRLVSGAGKDGSPQDGSPPLSSSPKSGSSLGSRQRSAIPMTPRSLGGAQANFARQMAERNQANRPRKTFKTSAPRGVKLGSGYVDRAKDREGDVADDDREERLKALEKSFKEEEIDQETYERLRFQIAGGDLSSTHLVKGLDFKLLRRIREGEDVYGEKKTEDEEPAEPSEDVDDEFDKMETKAVQAAERPKEEKKKKGQLSTVTLAPGKKRTRDQILAELKAARRAAKEQQESALGQGFKKIGAKQMPGTRIERDSKGREVMIIVDEDGHEKRKIRKVQPDEGRSELLMPDSSAKPLGMEVPEQYRKKMEEPEEDEDVDIFDNVGDDYDPLAGMEGSDDESDNNGEGTEKRVELIDSTHGSTKDIEGEAAMPPPPRPAQAASRNYFSNSKSALLSEEAEKAPSMSDPAIMAAIKKAAALNPIGRGDDDEGSSGEDERENEKALQERRKRLLEASNRDDDDIDMGFGTSRFEDEEDFDDSKVKLSTWGKHGDDGQDHGEKSKRKRGPKKRKGDANNAEDVLRVMEQQKKSR